MDENSAIENLSTRIDNQDNVQLLESGQSTTPKQNGVKGDRKNTFIVNRPVYTQHDFDYDHGGVENFRNDTNEVWLRMKIKTAKKWRMLQEKSCIEKVRFLGLLPPFIDTIRRYKWRRNLPADIVAGIIVGIMHIPQSMAYAFLVGLKPMYGLYTSFFPSLIYFFFGTSHHISIGTVAIVSLLTGKYLENSIKLNPIVNNETIKNFNLTTDLTNKTSAFSDYIEEQKAIRAAGLTICVGITQFLMGLCRLGGLTRYLSDPLLSGFTVGAAVHVLTSQAKSCLGLNHLPKQHGLFNIIRTYYSIFANIKDTNIPTAVLTLICVIILFINKQFINPRVVKKIKIPIPMELVMVICGTLASEYLHLNQKHQVKVVGKIAQGLPEPNVPNFQSLNELVSDVIITAIIAFSICISLGKMFAKKHGYEVDPNKEFIAYGLMNCFSSFFLCYPAAASVSRSAVQESVGGKTQLVSVFSCCLLLFVLLFIGPFFRSLPTCVLSAIIIVALKGIFMQFLELKELWRFSLWDFGTWIVTFLATAFLDVEYGLIIGVSVSVVTAMLRTQSPASHVLGRVKGTDLYKNIAVYDECTEIEGIKIFRYEGSLYFASCEHFKKSLFSKAGCDPRKVKRSIQKLKKKLKKFSAEPVDLEHQTQKDELEAQLEKAETPSLHHIIIDCSTWGYIDFVGVKTLCQVIEEYKSVNINVLLANPKTDIRRSFARSNFYHLIDDQIIYVSIHDAVVASLFERKISFT